MGKHAGIYVYAGMTFGFIVSSTAPLLVRRSLCLSVWLQVLIANERMSTNHVYCFKKRQPSKFHWTSEIRSFVDNSGRPPSSMYLQMYVKASEVLIVDEQGRWHDEKTTTTVIHIWYNSVRKIKDRLGVHTSTRTVLMFRNSVYYHVVVLI